MNFEHRKNNINNLIFQKEDLNSHFLKIDNYYLIDGSFLEGGGQILRNCISLAVLLKKNIKIINIRLTREKPGLKFQHLTGILLIQEIFNANIEGAKLNSKEIFFQPNKFIIENKKEFIADTKTAGSIGLLLQITLPCIIFLPFEIILHLLGGTNAINAPQIDYIEMVFKPIVEKFGIYFDLKIIKKGFYPKGGGKVIVQSKPILNYLKPITMIERGEIIKIYSKTFISELSKEIAIRISNSAEKKIQEYLKTLSYYSKIEQKFDIIEETKETAFGIGTGIIIIAITSTGCIIAGSALGEKGKKSEKVGQEAANSLIFNLKSEGCVDEYLQDQLILFMGLAKGISKIKTGPLTLHTKTSIYFCECLTGAKFTITKYLDKNDIFIIECEGIGFLNNN